MTSISFFLPMYNEEQNIRAVTEGALAALSQATSTFELILVNDGSRDRTGALADELSAEDKRIKPVHHPHNRGYGAALRSGFDAAGLDVVGFSDGDGQFDLSELPQLLAALEGADAVSGYRLVRKDPFLRSVNAVLFNRLVRLLFQVPVRDVNCAFKLFRQSALTGLVLKSEAALINAEMLSRLHRRGAVIREVGVHHYPRQHGTQTGANPLVILRTFAELFKLRHELR